MQPIYLDKDNAKKKLDELIDADRGLNRNPMMNYMGAPPNLLVKVIVTAEEWADLVSQGVFEKEGRSNAQGVYRGVVVFKEEPADA